MRLLNFIPVFICLSIFLAFGYVINSSYNEKDYVYKLANSKLSLVSGEILDLKSLKGKFYVLHLFASWCESCRGDYKLLKEIKDNTDAIIIGVAIRDKNLQPNNNKIYDYIAIDKNLEISRLVKNKNIPETIIINPEGMVIFHYKSVLEEEEIRNNVIPNISS